MTGSGWHAAGGDPGSCSALGARLGQSARALSSEPAAVSAAAATLAGLWQGPPADAVAATTTRDAASLHALAAAYAHAAEALQRFAQDLAARQARMGGLARTAAAHDLVLERDGSVTLPPGPYPSSRFEELSRWRATVLVEADSVAGEVRTAHRALGDALHRVRATAGGVCGA